MVTDRIVVGYDGSEHADAAVEWAAAEAERRGVVLKVVHVADHGGGLALRRPDLVQTAAQKIVAQGVERARTSAPEAHVEGAWAPSAVSYQLIHDSREAALLVVGTRGHGEAAGTLLGSVAFAVTAHAHCPVVVVRGKDIRPPGPGRPVVVGVDGSEHSQAALRLAASTAARTRAPLVVVSAHPPVDRQAWKTIGSWALEADVMRAYAAELRETASVMVDQAMHQARAAHPDLRVERIVVEGQAADVLADTASTAGLVVVGSRGRGAFAGLVLGSTSHRLVHTSPCPVAVTR